MPDGITQSNKDVMFKVLSQSYTNKSLAVYGLDLPRIKSMLPGSYPAVTATETHADNPFLLEDGTLLILEYESTTSKDDFLKYAGYVVNAFRRLRKEGVEVTSVVIAVVYTGDIAVADNEFDVGALRVRVEQVYLSRFDTNAMLADLTAKIESGGRLDDDDVMRLIILPLTEPDKAKKQKLIEDAVGLAKKLRDEGQKMFAVAGIVTATNKFIDEDYLKKLKEWIKMTKLARLYEEEKVEAVNQAVYQAVNQKSKEIARNFLASGLDIAQVMQATGLTRADIDEILTHREAYPSSGQAMQGAHAKTNRGRGRHREKRKP